MESPPVQAEKFGKYEIIRKLSRSMTDVYLARDTWTNQKVVLKKIEKSRDEFTRLAIEAETRGANIQRQLHQIDPRILAVYDCGELNNFFFVAMEYFEGRNLAEILQAAGRLDPHRAARYATEICSQLRTLHSFVTDYAGRRTAAIHGDIKPSNIQIGMKDDLRLLDFGISKNITATQNLTRHNLGSPSYCSPERLSKGQVDVHSDLWAVGVTLFEMLAGTPPYQAQDTRQLENIIQSKRPPRALPEDCPTPLKAIVAKALAGDQELRYHSTQEFENDLRAYLADETVKATRDHISWDSNATVDKSADKSAPPVPARPTVRVESNGATHPSDPAIPKARNNPTRLTKPQPPAAPKAAAVSHRWRFMQPGSTNVAVALITGIAAGLLVFIPFGYYFRLYNEMEPLRVARDYAHDAPALIDSDWTLYENLKARTQFLGPISPLVFVEGRLRGNLLAAGDSIIDAYRTSATTRPSDFDWARARKCLAHALEIDPSDTKTKGKLALAQGYFTSQRISKALLGASIESFRQAESYLPRSPDPHLGLARLYIYGYRNVAEADPEFQQAEQLGFHLGPREQSQKADGYMYRSEYELAQARRAAPKNRDEAEKWLQMSRNDIENARRLYEPLVGFANVSTNLEQLYQDRSEQIKLEEASLATQTGSGNP
jgi:serine/threonine protein kinase